MSYTKTTWNDLTAPAIDATNLNKIEQGIYDNSIDITSINTLIGSSGTATTTQTDFTEGQLTQKLGLKYIKMKGQTSQYTTQGNNLLNIYARHPAGYTETVSGVTITYNDDGSISAKGTATADINYFLASKAINGDDVFNGTHYLSGCSGGSATTFYLQFWADTVGTYQQTTTEVTTNKTAGVNWNITIGIKNGVTINKTFYPMMSATSGKTFEKYSGGKASPNPSYPQDVNNVTGSNVLKVCNKNLYDKDDSSLIMQAFINGAGNAIQGAGTARTLHIPILPNTTYTVSKIVSARFIIGTFESYEIGSVSTQRVITYTNQTSGSITTGANDKYLCVFYYLSTADTLSEEEIRNSIQIEVGSTATTYTAHKEEDYNIDLPVENLFDYTKSYVVSNASVETINDIVKLTATSTVISNNIFYRTKIDDSLLTNGQSYTLSYVGVQNVNSPLKLQLRNHDGSYATGQSQADTVTYDSNYSLFVVGNPFGASSNISISSGTVCIFKNVQVVKGTKTQAYTPYGTTPIELCKIGTYQDYIYEENGKWYKYGKIAKKKVVGSDIDKLQNSSGGIYQYRTLTGYLTNIITSANQWNLNLALCNYFKKYTNLNNLDALGFNTGGNGQLDINSDVTTLADFRTWVNSVDLVVYYVQETPTITEITYEPLLRQLDKLDKIGLYDISNISQDNSDMKMLLDFTICNDNYNGLREFIRA